jgi:hypothetical protein
MRNIEGATTVNDPDPPQPQNWADFIDSLHVFNPPQSMRVRWHRQLTSSDSRDAPVVRDAAGNRTPQSGVEPRS